MAIFCMTVLLVVKGACIQVEFPRLAKSAGIVGKVAGKCECERKLAEWSEWRLVDPYMRADRARSVEAACGRVLNSTTISKPSFARLPGYHRIRYPLPWLAPLHLRCAFFVLCARRQRFADQAWAQVYLSVWHGWAFAQVCDARDAIDFHAVFKLRVAILRA